MEALLLAIWPGILGGVMTAFVIYLSLRDMTRYGSPLTVLKWRAQRRESNEREAGTPNQQRG
jgi:hypothetical protein